MNANTTKLLVIEDEAHIRNMLKFSLPKEFLLFEVENYKQAELLMAKQPIDLILLDWMLPGKSGIEIAQQLKKSELTRNIPIIMLTAKAEEENKIRALETGADDYVTKPFSPRELVARIRSVLRRGPLASPEGILAVEDLRLNIHTHEVRVDHQTLSLTPTTYRLLYFFMKHPDKVYTREQLLQQVWEEHLDKDDRTVDVQIRRLRRALAPFGYDVLIQTVRAGGYKFSHHL